MPVLDGGGNQDHHVSLTDNSNIGFLVHLPASGNLILPVLVVQRKFAFTSWCGGSCHHGSVHIGTHLDMFENVYKRKQLFKHHEKLPEWHAPLDDNVKKTERVCCTSFTKKSLPMIFETLRGHEALGIDSGSQTIVPTKKKRRKKEDKQTKNHRETCSVHCLNNDDECSCKNLFQKQKHCGTVVYLDQLITVCFEELNSFSNSISE